jgi:uncharacterized protein YjbI with pentapeptide repeats
MANHEHVELVRRRIWGELDLLEFCDLAGADLQEADLSRARLRGADLSGARLWRANLREANLREANLREADLRRANLTGAILGAANLMDAVFDGSIITNACLWETQRAGWSIRGVVCEAVYWDEHLHSTLAIFSVTR